MTETIPKLFISYSWSSPDHEEWVLSLATELRESGIDVILDKWDLKEGHDAHIFMEKMVSDPDIEKVAIICDHLYANKSDARSGGVGTETQIITPEIYSRQDQNKFVAILSERDKDGNPYLPVYYKSRIYIDLSSADLYATNFEQLLRWIYGKPLHVKPDLGRTPAFLADGTKPSLQTTALFRRALNAVRDNRSNCIGIVTEYFESYVESLESFRIEKDAQEFDDKVIQNIDEFLPYRNEAIELFIAIARFHPTEESWKSLHRFFESLIPYLERPDTVNTWQRWDYDNFKFIIHELFLYAIVALIRFDRFSGVAELVRQHYYVEKNAIEGQIPMIPFTKFQNYLESFERRTKRLRLRRLSLHADLLEQRSKNSGFPFHQVMQVDLLLFIRDCIDCLRTGRRQGWWPMTLLYATNQHGPFEIFARSQSSKFFNELMQIFDIDSKDDLFPVDSSLREGKLRTPNWQFEGINPFELMGYDKIATLP